jgi:hypothetical protein
LVKGELDAARWNRVTAGISEAASVREYGAEYYADVARDAYRETVMAEGRTEKEYFDWRNEEIKRGIEHGFIELKPNGRIRPLEHCETVNRPAERLLTGKVNGHKKDSGISR